MIGADNSLHDYLVTPLPKTSETPSTDGPSVVDELLEISSALPYRISWRGSKVPRGGRFLGSSIQSAQHGRLFNDQGEDIGTYRRVKTFSGSSKDEHEIIAWSLLVNPHAEVAAAAETFDRMLDPKEAARVRGLRRIP